MADEATKKRVREALTTAYFHNEDDYVGISDGPDDSIHVVVISDQFNGKRMKEKHDLLWSVLFEKLDPEDWGKVTLTLGATPEQVKAVL